MKENLTELIFIVDQSGSMMHLTEDTIGGFNSLIDAQKNVPGEALVTLTLFDHNVTTPLKHINLKDVRHIDHSTYCAKGMTALLDAIGITVDDVGKRLAETDEADRPSKVMVVIITDGEENSSKQFTKEQIKNKLEEQTNKYNWEFLFIGANIDSFGEASALGISASNTANFTANSVGSQSVYRTVSDTMNSYRTTGNVDIDWAANIK